MLSTILVCTAINGVILSLMYLYFRKKLERAATSSALIETIRRETDELIVELNQTTERNIQLVEERIGRLNKLLKDADNRIVVLERQSERAAVKDTYEDLKVPRRTPQTVSTAEPTVRERILQLAAQGFGNAVIAGKVGLTLGEVDLIVSLETSKGGRDT